MGISVLHEDPEIVVVDKPAGMIVHPAPGHEDGAMTECLLGRFPEMAGAGSVERPGVVHRLDIGTSGVMVFARTQKAYLDLRRQFETHSTVEKKYLAVVHGRPRPASGSIDSPVGRGRLPALTHWTVLAGRNGISLVEFRIETGRMHQIRIHAAAMGCPVAGDAEYGDPARDRLMRPRPARTLLHSVELSFLHPATRKRVVFSAPPPPDIVYAAKC